MQLFRSVVVPLITLWLFSCAAQKPYQLTDALGDNPAKLTISALTVGKKSFAMAKKRTYSLAIYTDKNGCPDIGSFSKKSGYIGSVNLQETVATATVLLPVGRYVYLLSHFSDAGILGLGFYCQVSEKLKPEAGGEYLLSVDYDRKGMNRGECHSILRKIIFKDSEEHHEEIHDRGYADMHCGL